MTAVVEKEHLGGGFHAAPGSYSDEITVTQESRNTGTVFEMISISEIQWQRLVVFGVRYGFKLPQEVSGI